MLSFWRTNKLLILVIILAAISRFYGLDWDQGHYLHPDERLYLNASTISFPQNFQELLSPTSPLNPEMFYYGTFPLYLYKAATVTIFSNLGFFYTSRIISATFSILTVLIIFLIGKKFSKKIAILSALIFSFAAGSIQYAHFSTTESILVFLLSTIILLSIKTVEEKNYLLFIPLGILLGLSYATKITGLTFSILPALSFLILLIQDKKIGKVLLWGVVFTALAVLTGVIFAPYQIIDYSHFAQEQDYMQGVTYGKSKPPFVIIYEETTPYLYPLIKILPFTLGFISFPLALLGLLFITKEFIKKRDIRYLFLVLFPLFYFLWAGAWYAKFARYFILLFPFLSLWAAITLEKFKKPLLILLTVLISINGIIFLKIYQRPNTRVEASSWIYDNIPSGAVLSAEHWDDRLPLPFSDQTSAYLPIDLTVYDSDDQNKVEKLTESLAKSDYFIISSRRVYYSIIQNSLKYPTTSNFYKLLFENKLGFTLIKQFNNYPFIFSDDFADETFQSYDHPPVFVFQNTGRLTSFDLQQLITQIP